jgi:hypothetical protein
LEENVRAGRLGLIRELLEYIPMELLENGTYRDGLSDDIFIKTLVNNIRNECVSYQIFLAKQSNITVKSLQAKLFELKSNFNENHPEIIRVEK